VQRDLGLGDRTHHRQVVELLAQGDLMHARPVAIGEGDHREPVERRMGEAVGQVGHAGADRRERDANRPGALAVDTRGDDRRGLVLREHEVDPVRRAGAHQFRGRTATGNAEDPVHARLPQRGEHLFGDRLHRMSPALCARRALCVCPCAPGTPRTVR
jgi:hypothetical protein